jgi:hypothetical protein
MQGRGNARFPCTPSPKPTSTTNNRLAARTGKKLGCGNDARWNPWKSPTPTFPPLPPHLEIPQQTRDSHIPTATTTTGCRGLDQHQTKFNTKINTNNKTKVVYTDNLTHPPSRIRPFRLPVPQYPHHATFPHPRLSNRTGGVTASGSRKRHTMLRVTPSATSEHNSGWLDSSSIPMSCVASCVRL